MRDVDGRACALAEQRFCFDMYKSKLNGEAESLAVTPLILFLLRLALGGVALGLAFGVVMLYWLSLCSRKLEHGDVTVQVAITLVGSYACFYMAENTAIDVSGVLAVVVQGTFLAATAWPVIADKSTMTHAPKPRLTPPAPRASLTRRFVLRWTCWPLSHRDAAVRRCGTRSNGSSSRSSLCSLASSPATRSIRSRTVVARPRPSAPRSASPTCRGSSSRTPSL
jgi:hypothetical protein